MSETKQIEFGHRTAANAVQKIVNQLPAKDMCVVCVLYTEKVPLNESNRTIITNKDHYQKTNRRRVRDKSNRRKKSERQIDKITTLH